MDGNNSLYDLSQYLAVGKGFVVTSGSCESNSIYTQPPVTQATIATPLLYGEESVDFSELVEACEKNVTPPAPISGSDCSSACCFFEEKPFPFDKLVPMYNEEASHFCVPGPPPSTASQDFTPQETPSLPIDEILTSTTSSHYTFSHSHPTTHNVHASLNTHSNQLSPKQSRLAKQPKKVYDKNSDEYRDKRERNNVAVRKSRNKMKQRAMETEKRVHELEEENATLQNQVSLLMKELKVLKGLLTSADSMQQQSGSSNMDVNSSGCS